MLFNKVEYFSTLGLCGVFLVFLIIFVVFLFSNYFDQNLKKKKIEKKLHFDSIFIVVNSSHDDQY
jgi:hypothetical protein